jgi:hypothetical protein
MALTVAQYFCFLLLFWGARILGSWDAPYWALYISILSITFMMVLMADIKVSLLQKKAFRLGILVGYGILFMYLGYLTIYTILAISSAVDIGVAITQVLAVTSGVSLLAVLFNARVLWKRAFT